MDWAFFENPMRPVEKVRNEQCANLDQSMVYTFLDI